MYRTEENDRLVKTGEAAEMLGCSVAWLERGRCHGYGPPYHKVRPGGRLVRYRIGDLWAYRDANRIDPAGDR